MKAAITGGTKSPSISSHPHHIDIKDKQDGSANFQCMRINSDSRADRNLFCQVRLMVQNLRAYAIKIEVGQEEGGTTRNPTTMVVNWCEEEQVEEKRGFKPTYEITTSTTKKSNKHTTHTSTINITTRTTYTLPPPSPTHTPPTHIPKHIPPTNILTHTMLTRITHTILTHTHTHALPIHTLTQA